MSGLALPPGAKGPPSDVLEGTICPIRSAMLAAPQGIAACDVPCRSSCMWFVPPSLAQQAAAPSFKGSCAIRVLALATR